MDGKQWIDAWSEKVTGLIDGPSGHWICGWSVVGSGLINGNQRSAH